MAVKKSVESKTNQGAGLSGGEEVQKKLSRDEVAAFLADIEKNLVQSSMTSLHSMVALNEILRRPEAKEIFDQPLRDQARDIWRKIRLSGLDLIDPPLLFGDDIAIPAEFELGEDDMPQIDGAGR